MDNQTHHQKQKNNPWMIAALVLLVIALLEGFYIYHKRAQQAQAIMAGLPSGTISPQPRMGTRPKPMFVLKGQKFSDNPLFPRAYLIAPVTSLSDDAKKALTGWNVKTTSNNDGSMQIDLIPNEAEDVRQSFTLKPGYKLYFIEMTLSDDKTGVDENRGDDIGVLVDQNGIVQ